MEAFEAELAKATNLGNRDLLGAVAMVIDNNGEAERFSASVEMRTTYKDRVSDSYCGT